MDHLKAVGGEIFYQDGIYTARIEYLSDDGEKTLWSCSCQDPQELETAIEEEINTREGIKQPSYLVLQSMIMELQEFMLELEAEEDRKRRAQFN